MAARPAVARICARPDPEPDLADYLIRRGFEVHVAHEEWSAIALLSRRGMDLAVVDVENPECDGIGLLRRFGTGGPSFVMIGNDMHVVEKVLALELGASDVVTRPLVPREIASRLNRLLERRGRTVGELVQFENATVDMKAALVMHRSGAEDQLSAGQVAMVRLFADNPGKVLGRDDIVAAAPAESFDAFDRSVDSRIVRLRRKLDTERIVTVRGAGYRFDPPE